MLLELLKRSGEVGLSEYALHLPFDPLYLLLTHIVNLLWLCVGGRLTANHCIIFTTTRKPTQAMILPNMGRGAVK